MEFKLCKFKGGKKGAYTLTFDDGCYYDSTRDVEAIFDKVLERDGVKLCATVGITTGFMHERLINMWRELIDKGYFDIASHSVSHCICPYIPQISAQLSQLQRHSPNLFHPAHFLIIHFHSTRYLSRGAVSVRISQTLLQ